MSDTLPTFDTGRLGPAMEALPPRMRQFVMAIIQTGCTNAKAADLAGYQGGPDTWKAMGWRLAHDSRVQAAIQEEAAKLIRTSAVMAIGVVQDIARNPNVDPKDRLKAALAILDRSGLHAHTEHTLKVEHQPSESETLRQIKELAERLGVDPVQFLGRYGYAVDADFTVVTPAGDAPGDEWTIQPKGLAHDTR